MLTGRARKPTETVIEPTVIKRTAIEQ